MLRDLTSGFVGSKAHRFGGMKWRVPGCELACGGMVRSIIVICGGIASVGSVGYKLVRSEMPVSGARLARACESGGACSIEPSMAVIMYTRMVHEYRDGGAEMHPHESLVCPAI